MNELFRQKIDKLWDFLKLVRQLEETYRFTPKSGGGYENDAEHSWSVAMTCLLVAGYVEAELGVTIDQLKLLKMALIHDLAEIIAKDTKTWDEKARVGKEERERQAMAELLGKLPDELANELLGLWEECEKRETVEAMIVKSTDRLDPVMHRTIFEIGYENIEDEHATVEALDERQLPRHQFSEFLTQLYMKIRNESVEKGCFKVKKG